MEKLKGTSTQRIIKFWKKVDEDYPHNRIKQRIALLESGRGDWFRDFGLLNITLSNSCWSGHVKIQRFDEEKYNELIGKYIELLCTYGFYEGMMYN